MDARETIETIRRVLAFPEDLNNHIIGFVVPFTEILEKMQNQMDLHVLAIEHYFRSAYRQSKFYNDNVKAIVFSLFSIEQSVGAPHLNRYLHTIDILFRHILSRFSPQKLLHTQPERYIDILQYHHDVFTHHHSVLLKIMPKK